MSFRVLLPEPIAREGMERLVEAGLQIVEPPACDAATLGEYIEGCRGVLLRTAVMSPEVMRRAPGLEVIARHGVGLDNIDLGYCARRGIVVTSTPEANATAVAEHTIGMIVAVTKNLLLHDREVRAGNFEARNRHYGIELQGRMLGVFGLGRIGRLVAERAASGLGMRVVGYVPDEVGPGCVMRTTLEGLLDGSDVVTLHLLLTLETRGLFDGEIISRMEDGAYLVNCARGGIVDEMALAEALRSGRLSGAALDVFAEEPTPKDHPLWDLENVVLTPHVAALTRESVARMAVHAAEGVISVARGGSPRWPVDLTEPREQPRETGAG